MIAIDSNMNQFLMSAQPGTQMTVLLHFKESFMPKEYFVVESRTTITIMYLIESDIFANDKILKLFIHLDDVDVKMGRFEYELISFYNTIIPIDTTTESIYGIRSNSKIIEILKLEGSSIKVMNAIDTPHQMKHFDGWIDGRHLVTWGIDGIVGIFNTYSNHKLLSSFVAGSRHNFGLKKARCDTKGNYAIALDYSGNLICTKLNIEWTEYEQKKIDEEMSNYQALVTENFLKTTSGGWPGLLEEHQENKKYIDLKGEKAYKMEVEESEETKQELFRRLKSLRLQVKKLLDENEKNADAEQLKVQEFNLDLATTAQKEDEARQERNQQNKKMQDFINAQTAMNNWIVEKCWNHLTVKGTKLRAMFLNMFIENYPLTPEKVDGEMRRIELLRAVENSVARNDTFLPWRPIPTV